MILINARENPPIKATQVPGEASYYYDPRPKLGGDFLAWTKASKYDDRWIKALRRHYQGDSKFERPSLFFFEKAPYAKDHAMELFTTHRDEVAKDVYRWQALMGSMIRCMAHWTLDFAVRDFLWQEHHLMQNVEWEPDTGQTFRAHLVQGDVIGLYGMPEYDESNEMTMLLNNLIAARYRDTGKPKITLMIGPHQTYPACLDIQGIKLPAPITQTEQDKHADAPNVVDSELIKDDLDRILGSE